MLVEQVRRQQLHAIHQVRDPLVRRGRAASDDAHHPIAFGQQVLGEIGAILARDSGDQRGRHGTWWWSGFDVNKKGSLTRSSLSTISCDIAQVTRLGRGERVESCLRSSIAYRRGFSWAFRPREYARPGGWASRRGALCC